jgi:hypothetical protein
MELGSKVTALEEEVAVLKGEIKTILQEVRTAVLARENPFAAGAYENLPIPTQSPAPEAEFAPLPLTPAPEEPQPETSPKVIQLHTLPELEQPGATTTPFPGRDETDAARSRASTPRANRRWSVGSLATLVAWTQETAARLDETEMDIVLSLARYGGLIDEELETTLIKLSAPLLSKNLESGQKGASDYLLALRELSALIEEAEDSYRDAAPLRRVS